jgi:cytosine/adenosine deaminase-related metal-dependent hydrolase
LAGRADESGQGIQEYGSVSEGKYADIIAVKGDVLRYIDLLQRVDLVVKHGKRVKQRRRSEVGGRKAEDGSRESETYIKFFSCMAGFLIIDLWLEHS